MREDIKKLITKLDNDNLDENDIKLINNLMFSFPSSCEKVDLVLVLGSSSIKRIEKAVEIALQYQVPILISGGNYLKKEDLYEYEKYYIYSICHGLKKEDIILEKDSTNTLENITNSFNIIKDNYTTIAIVSSSQHLLRVKLMLTKMGLVDKYNFSFVASYAKLVPKDNWDKEKRAKEIIRGELERVINYNLI